MPSLPRSWLGTQRIGPAHSKRQAHGATLAPWQAFQGELRRFGPSQIAALYKWVTTP